MSPEEFCERYKEALEGASVEEGDPNDRVESAAMAFGLGEADVVLGQHKVRFYFSFVEATATD